MTAGYSGTPLPVKLGLKPGLTVYLDAPPRGLPAGLDLGGFPVTTRLPRAVDVTLLFSRDRARLEKRLPVVLERTVPDGMVWVCWPKRASKVETDLDENVVRRVGLALGVVDVKVAAIDQTWSGLRFVRRLADR